MGTSLASPAAGNLEAMAGQMVVAFTTAIIGLASCGAKSNPGRRYWISISRFFGNGSSGT
jgi:hypothetical protein